MFVRWLMSKSERFKAFVRNQRVQQASIMDNSIYLPAGFDRVYHIHIRKSAGSSLNDLFYAQSGLTLNELWREPIYIKNKKVYVQHSKDLINAGNYYYASSHFPIWELDLKPNTFTYCILRNPLERLISLYKYYCWVYQVDPKTGYQLDPSYFVLLKQKHLLNCSFSTFVQQLSDKYLYSELYSFDKQLNPHKALHWLGQVNKIYFFDHLDYAIKDLTEILHLAPKPLSRTRSFKNVDYKILPAELEVAKQLLKDEITFYNTARDKYLITE